MPAFKSNFGFTPPRSAKEVSVRNFGFRDGYAQWMTFAYDPKVFKRPEVFDRKVENDSPLLKTIIKSPEHDETIKAFSK